MTFVFIVLFFSYALLVGLLIFGWRKSLKQEVPPGKGCRPSVSVVIAARNESSVIQQLLEDISVQTHDELEVIVVDDNSTDATSNIVLDFESRDSRFKLIQSNGEGKKAALTTGIQVASGEIIITTDADCRVNKNWVSIIADYFQNNETMLVFGGVRIESESFWSALQAHEFVSLIGTAAATLSWGFPSMCNGANLAFRKKTFHEVGGYSNNFHIPSGDDEFLMHKIFHIHPDGVRFVSHKQAVVATSSVCPRDFLHQRVRWAGKWSHNLSLWNIILAVFIFLFQLSVIALPFSVFAGTVGIELALFLLGFKIFLELLFLKNVAEFLDVRWRWSGFFALQIIYPFYVIIVGMISTYFPFKWKGRTLKSVTVSMVRK